MSKLKSEIENHLLNHILPFWINLKDEQNGGFFGKVNYDLTVNKEADKGGIAASRFLWSFSAAYRVTKRPEYLECAHHAYSFLVEKIYDHEHQGLFWQVDYKGNPVEDQKHVYTQSFGVYALSEYYLITKSEEALQYANKIFNLIETIGFDKDNNAYKEEFDREWNELPNEKLSENGVVAEITTNTHLHVLEAYTNLYKASAEEVVKERLTNLIEIFYEKIYDKDTKFLNVFFDKHWNSLLHLKSFGHDIEASWLIDDALNVLGLEDERFVQMVIDIAYNIADAAILEDGSLANEQHNDDVDLTRIWWVQAEAMVGFHNAYERTNDEKFLTLVNGLWEYTKNNIVDYRDGGEWYWSVEPDGKPTERAVGEPWKTPYHNSRFCLEMMERIENK
ncbi:MULTISPECIES: AGE family epimerase/isomerase [Metabacillus]|uniref:Cellobiose 2-epimerase n=2 Tax=Metabacillus TaxID=2675233 RepID=A0A179T558_9BACI|nr:MULTISPECIES: AGE family epimerase/isomerase [Metabacillus]OAS87592.1 N-acylglucosamine 2-epimerase [Metabacillus litoralis]QNF27011.1 AGE family epimerase/isomerase [Metabacillus sp. KUDC1714]